MTLICGINELFNNMQKKKSTKDVYKRSLLRLIKILELDNSVNIIEYLNANHDKIFNKISEIPYGSKKSILTSILVLLKEKKQNSEKYKKKLLSITKQNNEKLKDQKMTEKQKKNWISV